MQTALVMPARVSSFSGLVRPHYTPAVALCRSKLSTRFTVRPVAATRSRDNGVAEVRRSTAPEESSRSQETLGSKVQTLVKNSAKVAAIMGVALALVLGNVNPAHAARSAGRAGGFHSSAPSRSYGGGGGMSRSYGGGGMSRGYSGGYSGGFNMYSAPRIYGPPVVVPSPPIIVPGPSVYATPGVTVVRGGPDIVDIAMITVFMVMAVSAATSMYRSGDGGFSLTGSKPTLTRVQVGLVSLARQLKWDLDRIAARADTSDSRGLHHLLQEVVLALLRNPNYCIYGAASQKTTDSMSSLEATFNKASMKERSKFEQETLVNVTGAAPRRSSLKPSSRSSKPDELIVVTLLVATSAGVDVPDKINSLADLKQALQALGSVPQDEVLGVEVMWTPQAEGDYYTREEIITDYPNLRQL